MDILDLYSYSGAFSLNAAMALNQRAHMAPSSPLSSIKANITTVDSSDYALDFFKRNCILNGMVISETFTNQIIPLTANKKPSASPTDSTSGALIETGLDIICSKYSYPPI